jgi:hypothetical protein
VPDAGSHREEALADAGVDTMPGPGAVLFEGELAFQGIEDCFDPLPQAQQAAFGLARREKQVAQVLAGVADPVPLAGESE